jgi:patatin-like phospholipase/acyl hydrolase
MATKRILTIDGGGLRGVFAAAIIEGMEKAVGKPAGEIFDSFYGTSAGAILAAGLASGMNAAELKQFYLEKGAKVFEKLPWYRIIKRNLYWTYSKKQLEEELRAVFKDKKIFDLQKLLSIQTKDTETGTVAFFNNFPYTPGPAPRSQSSALVDHPGQHGRAHLL